MTAAELKASILDLAVRGLLVPQDPKDKPAAKPSDIDDPPYELPRNWVWARFGEVCGFLHRGKSPTYCNSSPYPMFAQKCNQPNGIFLDKCKFCAPEKYIKFQDEYKLRDLDVVINSTGTGTLGRIGLFRSKYLTAAGFNSIVPDSHVTVARARKEVLPQFLFYFLRAPNTQKWLLGNSDGSTNQIELYTKTLAKLITPLPPLPEQKRIVAKIEELMPMVEEYGAAQKELEALNADFPAALRESILQDAVQGKLTAEWRRERLERFERFEKFETARDLLDQIAAEKKRLLTAKKIKKEKPLPPITDDEKPFEIPDTWAWCRLGEIGQWGSGATPSKANKAYYQGGKIPWLVTGDLTDGDVTDIPGRITDLALEETSVRLNPPGSVLLAMYGATIGKLGILQVASTTNQACCACQTMPGLYNRYLFYYLLSQRRAFQKRGEGGAQPNISKEKIVVTPFPFPPLAEQKAIVERVDELLKIVDAMKAQ